MINKITKDIEKSIGDLYDILTGDFDTITHNEHRRGSTFYREVVQEMTKELCEEFNIPEEYIGLWKSNQFVWSEEDYDKDDMFPFVRVTKETKEVIITQTYYKEV